MAVMLPVIDGTHVRNALNVIESMMAKLSKDLFEGLIIVSFDRVSEVLWTVLLI